MQTKFGNAEISKLGYYVITSRKEGNNMKKLHRLVFEDYYNCKLDKNDVIHHIDGDKLNNHPANLICMSQKAHGLLHHTNKTHSEESMMKMSKRQNTSGYFRVYKRKNKTYKQGFIWQYLYYEDGKQKSINSVDIKKLEQKVKAKGLKWKKLKGDE